MHKLLIEALLEDIFSDLIKKFPTQEAQLKQAKNEGVLPKYLPWLAKILTTGSSEPIEDIIPVIKAFHNKQPALKAKFPDEPSVIDINYYKSVADLSDKLESLVSIKYQSAPSDSDILFQDKRWLVAMPRTTAGSCELGKDTAWCTARTGSQNLFLSYVGRGKNIFLFYVIDKEGNPRSNPDAKLSIGFINGEPDFRGVNNGPTVNAAQSGIKKKRFQKIVGADNADKFISLMQAKIKSYNDVHPAQEEMDTLARDPILLKKKLDGFVNEEERIDFAELILENKSVSPEVLRVIATLDNEKINRSIARNSNTPPDILEKLSHFDSDMILRALAQNPNCPPDVILKLSDHVSPYVQADVAKREDIPLHILEKLSHHKNGIVLANVCKNPNCPSDILVRLSEYNDKWVRRTIAKHLNTPPHILLKLGNDPNYEIQWAAKDNPNYPKTITESRFKAYIASFFNI